MLKNEIGINAGKIWHLLSEKGSLSIRQIGEQTGYPENIIACALGWLARENKVHFIVEKAKVNVELTNNFQENYL